MKKNESTNINNSVENIYSKANAFSQICNKKKKSKSKSELKQMRNVLFGSKNSIELLYCYQNSISLFTEKFQCSETHKYTYTLTSFNKFWGPKFSFKH